MLISVLYGLIVMFAVLTLGAMLRVNAAKDVEVDPDASRIRKAFTKFVAIVKSGGALSVLHALFFGAVVWFAFWASTWLGVNTWPWAWATMFAMLFVVVAMAIWSVRKAGAWKELAMVVAIMLGVTFLATGQAGLLADIGYDSNLWLASFVKIIPWIVFTACAGVALFFLLQEKKRDLGDEIYGIAAKVVAILTVIIVALMLIFGIKWGFGSGESESKPTPTPKPVTTATSAPTKTETWYDFGAWYVWNDDNPENDFNFGLTPKADKTWTSKEYFEDFVKELKRDPLRGAAVMSAVDAGMKTSFLDEFREDGKDELFVVNKAIRTFVDDEEAYYKRLQYLLPLLTRSDASLWEGTARDQFYQTMDGPIPRLVVYNCDEVKSRYLRLHWSYPDKGVEFTLLLHIPCGYQPANVAELIKVTPENPTPVVVTPPPVPVVTPTPEKEDGKDPKFSPPDIEPNEPDDGPGPEHTPEPEDSLDYPDKPSYDEWIDRLEEANDRNPPGDQTPTVELPADNSPDNNGDKIDPPTEVKPAPTIDDAPIKKTPDKPAAEVERPPA